MPSNIDIFSLTLCFILVSISLLVILAILIKFFEDNPHLFLFFYFITYVILTSFSLPGATVLTIVGGGIFGIFVGTIVVSFASSIGATFAMLISRYLARKWVQKKFSKEMQKINHRINIEGVYYLFSLRGLCRFENNIDFNY